MNRADFNHKYLINKILNEGSWDRNPRPKYEDGTPAHSKYITQIFEEYDISKGELPITTLRPIHIMKAIKEILWIYQDQTNSLITLEKEHGINWWRPWAVTTVVTDEFGDKSLSYDTIGQRYGATVKRYDLMNKVLKGLIDDPFGRRHLVNLLQETDLNETDGLYPCAFMFLLSVREVEEEMYLDMTLTQRSSDYLVAGHINMMQYVALLMMIAHHCGYKVGRFARLTQNLHIYDRHIEQAYKILEREPSNEVPKLTLNAEGKSFYEIKAEDFVLENYNPVKPQLKFDLGI
jgi:thymidylate synthase